MNIVIILDKINYDNGASLEDSLGCRIMSYNVNDRHLC